MWRAIPIVLLVAGLLLAACAQEPVATPSPSSASGNATQPTTPPTAGSTTTSASATPAAATVAPTATPAVSPTPEPLTKVTVALDWYPWANHTGMYLAREHGYYEAEGLDVEMYVPANPEDGLKLVAAGRDTFGISYQTDVLLARAKDIPVKSVAALVQEPLNTIMALKSSNITHPSQLEGKTVGIAGLPSDEALLKTMMTFDGGDPDKVEIVNVGFDLVPALIGQRVDAIVGGYWVHESILAELQGYPVNVMKVQDFGVPSYYELVLVASDQTVADQPDLVRRFLRATAKGYADAANDHEAAIDLLVKVNPETNREMEEQGLPLLAPLWTKGVDHWGQQTATRWRAYSEWMKGQGLLPQDVKPEEAVALNLTGP